MTRRASRSAVAAQLLTAIAVAGLAACSPQPPATSPAGPSAETGTGGAAAPEILVVDQSELDAIRAKYEVSAPRGEVTATATCDSGQADQACTAAAHQQLRDEAKKRGATLVVITSTAMRQTFPPQLTLRATLYDIRPR
jgi:hypothetical protein